MGWQNRPFHDAYKIKHKQINLMQLVLKDTCNNLGTYELAAHFSIMRADYETISWSVETLFLEIEHYNQMWFRE